MRGGREGFERCEEFKWTSVAVTFGDFERLAFASIEVSYPAIGYGSDWVGWSFA